MSAIAQQGSFLQGLMKGTGTTPRPRSPGGVDGNERTQGLAQSLRFLCHGPGQCAQHLPQLLGSTIEGVAHNLGVNSAVRQLPALPCLNDDEPQQGVSQ